MRYTRTTFAERALKKRLAKAEWHFWFAWYPVIITGTKVRFWLEFVLRRGERFYGGWHYQYDYPEVEARWSRGEAPATRKDK